MRRNRMVRKDHIVPPHVSGRTTGATASKECASKAEAIALFKKARNRLFDINNWYGYTGESMVSAEFRLTDATGKLVDRKPQKGDYIRIDLPGPGANVGDGYDWVEIESIIESEKFEESDIEFCAVRARPAPNPTDQSEETAHFYTELASSTFKITRFGKEVIAEEIGRNEKANNAEISDLKDKVRNTVFAETASRGLAWPQWKVLMEGFLK